MNTQNQPFDIAPTLEGVKQQFTHWRHTRTKRTKIPERLWDQALSLLGRYTENKILQALHISQPQLRKEQYRRGQIQTNPIRTQQQPQFIDVTAKATQAEFNTENLPNNNLLTLELKRPDGTTLNIKGLPLVEVGTMMNHFYGAQ